MKTKLRFIMCLLVLASVNRVMAQAPVLYELHGFNKPSKEKVGFISLSDNYPVSEHPDSLALPPDSTKEYFKLDATYRKRFLSGTRVLESDNIFIYDYATDMLVTIPVKQLAAVAFLSPYVSGDEPPFRHDDYMIGFEIDKKLIRGFSENDEALVYIGKDNPFSKGQVKPMMWKKITVKEFPAIADNPEIKEMLGRYEHNSYTYDAAYKSQSDGFTYYARDIIADSALAARQLVITEAKTNKVITERVFYEEDGTSLTPLNGMNEEGNNYKNQYAGRLFKDRPPVVFGFEYTSFGCPRISVISSSKEDIYINCDNRH